MAVQHKHPSIKIMMRWMPGHKGILGNEWVDEESKWMAMGESSELCTLPVVCRGMLPTGRSAAHQ